MKVDFFYQMLASFLLQWWKNISNEEQEICGKNHLDSLNSDI